MSSVSKKQHNFMAMMAHNPEEAAEKGISQNVAEEFLEADKKHHFYGKRKPNPMRLAKALLIKSRGY